MEIEEIFLPKKSVSSTTIIGSTTVHVPSSSEDDNGNQNNVVSDLPSTNSDKKPMNKTLKNSLIVVAFLVPIIAGIIYVKRKKK